MNNSKLFWIDILKEGNTTEGSEVTKRDLREIYNYFLMTSKNVGIFSDPSDGVLILGEVISLCYTAENHRLGLGALVSIDDINTINKGYYLAPEITDKGNSKFLTGLCQSKGIIIDDIHPVSYYVAKAERPSYKMAYGEDAQLVKSLSNITANILEALIKCNDDPVATISPSLAIRVLDAINPK